LLNNLLVFFFWFIDRILDNQVILLKEWDHGRFFL